MYVCIYTDVVGIRYKRRSDVGSKRNRSHTQKHDKNNTTNDHMKDHPLT